MNMRKTKKKVIEIPLDLWARILREHDCEMGHGKYISMNQTIINFLEKSVPHINPTWTDFRSYKEIAKYR